MTNITLLLFVDNPHFRESCTSCLSKVCAWFTPNHHQGTNQGTVEGTNQGTKKPLTIKESSGVSLFSKFKIKIEGKKSGLAFDFFFSIIASKFNISNPQTLAIVGGVR
jgi:hypothetical protein